VLAAAGLVALAWFFPPLPLLPPEVDPGALQAPAAPGQPDGVAGRRPAATGPEPAPAPEKPQIADAPALEAAPSPAH
jgi:hypothetical protein